MPLAELLRKRRVTNVIRGLLDDWLPPVVRELRPLNQLLARRFFRGADFDLDFKEKAFAMSDAEIASAYARLAAGVDRYRGSDTSEGQMRALVAATVGATVLEVGAGNGELTERLAAAGHAVTAVEVARHSLDAIRARTPAVRAVAAGLPHLPFADRSFDTVVCAHTLEHIPRVWDAAAELRRVAARRLLVVVPRQRYYRYTIDYHLHFFPSAAPLAALLGLPRAEVTTVDGDWLYVGERRSDSASHAPQPAR
jgi:ubiquinone/menaquinone biosynthesis C-methylase UbiE